MTHTLAALFQDHRVFWLITGIMFMGSGLIWRRLLSFLGRQLEAPVPPMVRSAGPSHGCHATAGVGQADSLTLSSYLMPQSHSVPHRQSRQHHLPRGVRGAE